MRPISDINIGDQYERGYPFELVWSVYRIDPIEKMVEIQAFGRNAREANKPFWKHSSDSIFRKRIFNGKTNIFEG